MRKMRRSGKVSGYSFVGCAQIGCGGVKELVEPEGGK